MASTLVAIEQMAKHYARDNSLDIDTASSIGLAITNRIYRSLVAAFPWPEFRQTLPTTSTPTVSGTESYEWEFSTTVGSGEFIDVRSVEVGSNASNTDMLLVIPAPTERAWSEAGKAANGQPVYYMRSNVTGEARINFRPVPGYNTGVIQATGTVEPYVLASGGTTGFALLATDDVLSMLIAADWLMHDGQEEAAGTLLKSAQQLLGSIWGKESVTSEILFNIIGA